MRLLRDEGDGRLNLVEYHDDRIPPYAILSHTWGAEEVTYKDLTDGTGQNKAGYEKIEFCRKQAARDKIPHFWVDTCCIDKSSSAELSEAINSMFRWYRKAVKCYVYLADVLTAPEATGDHSSSTAWKAAFRRSRWFTRGWTLQELVAPASVEFFSQEHDYIGSKQSLEEMIHEITGIAIEVVRGESPLGYEIEERFSWAKDRETTRREDKAYSLLGLFDIFMPLLYGEGRKKAFARLREAIDKSLLAPIKQSESSPSPSSTVPFRHDVDFVDRGASQGDRTLLGQIEQQCTVPAVRVALVGIGGVGKSQLAIEYCHRFRKQSPEKWVFWIHASNIDRVRQGYREIAERAQIPGRDNPKVNILDLVTRWLRDETKGPWLLVLDNLDNENVLSIPDTAASKAQSSHPDDGLLQRPLSTYLPQSEHGAILITTRTRSVATKLVEPRDVISVEPMMDQDAVALLQKKLDQPTNGSDLRELAKILEYMPLAIVQAAAYIQEKGSRYSVRQYIETFQKSERQQRSLLNYEAGHIRRDPGAKNSIIITWQISFDEIREKWPASAELLSLMSYFDPQGIPEEVLKVQLRGDDSKVLANQTSGVDREDFEEEDEEESDRSEASSDDVFEEAITRLQSYLFVWIGEKRRTLEMHRLVQLATRKWLAMHKEEEKWRVLFCRKLNAVFPNGQPENWGWCEVLFPHVKSAERQRPAGVQSVQEWARILRNAAWYATAKGDYNEAERMCEKSVGALRNAFSEDIEISYSLGMLASIYSHQGRWAEAEKIEVQVIETRKRVLGDEHPDTLTSMNNFASIYRDQGRWTEAEKMQVQVTETMKRVLGDEHPLTLTSMSNLAFTLKEQDRTEEAIQLMAECVQLRNRVLGSEHPHAHSSAAVLADWQSVEDG